MQIKEIKTKLLLILFLIPNDSFGFITLNQNIQKIFNFSLNEKTNKIILSLLKNKLIEERENDTLNIDKQQNTSLEFTEEKKLYGLTKQGYYSLCIEFPFFRFLNEEWDGVWRVISYEIPERKREIRDRLRREMRGWGLGPWHRSFWLTPHPVIENLRELIFGKEEEKYVQAFESTHVFGDLQLLVEKVWDKSRLTAEYRELFKKWHAIMSADKSNQEKMKELISLYIDVLRIDPGLPKSLIGRDWLGYEAFPIFKRIKQLFLK